jgi:TRAP-type C4-dicarboxylate transport system substrate-binding protein
MMNKNLFGLTVIFLSIFVFAATGSSTNYKPEYKMSIVVGPEGPWGESAARFAEAVRRATDGRINIKPYYNGQLFAGRQMNEFQLMKEGVIDFAAGSTINWSSTVKKLNIFSLPFSSLTITRWMRSSMGKLADNYSRLLRAMVSQVSGGEKTDSEILQTAKGR